MGQVAGELADHVIVTTDNPRYEAPHKIAEEIAEGMEKEQDFYEIILDRREAVVRAVEMAEEKDIVVIAGKGHEPYQEIEGVRYEMDDHELLKDALQKKYQKEQREEQERVEDAHVCRCDH